MKREPVRPATGGRRRPSRANRDAPGPIGRGGVSVARGSEVRSAARLGVARVGARDLGQGAEDGQQQGGGEEFHGAMLAERLDKSKRMWCNE